MKWDPFTDAFAASGYWGYSLRAIARRIAENEFVPRLEIRDRYWGESELLYERTFSETFVNPDNAIHWSMAQGQQIVDYLLERKDLDESAGILH